MGLHHGHFSDGPLQLMDSYWDLVDPWIRPRILLGLRSSLAHHTLDIGCVLYVFVRIFTQFFRTLFLVSMEIYPA